MRLAAFLAAIVLAVYAMATLAPSGDAYRSGSWSAKPTMSVTAGETSRSRPASQRLQDQIRREYGVEVVFDLPRFARSWTRRAAPAYSLIPRERRDAVLKSLKAELARYKSGFVRKHLQTVYLFEKLSFYGVTYGGTVDPKRRSVYLVESWLDRRHEGLLPGAFHHEFSSIWLASEPFPEKAWRALNASDFRYPLEGEGHRKITEGDTRLYGTPQLYARGFVAGYGTNAFEEDFNTFAQLYMADPEHLERLARRYPAIRAKANLLDDYARTIGVK